MLVEVIDRAVAIDVDARPPLRARRKLLPEIIVEACDRDLRDFRLARVVRRLVEREERGTGELLGAERQVEVGADLDAVGDAVAVRVRVVRIHAEQCLLTHDGIAGGFLCFIGHAIAIAIAVAGIALSIAVHVRLLGVAVVDVGRIGEVWAVVLVIGHAIVIAVVGKDGDPQRRRVRAA